MPTYGSDLDFFLDPSKNSSCKSLFFCALWLDVVGRAWACPMPVVRCDVISPLPQRILGLKRQEGQCSLSATLEAQVEWRGVHT